jgi:murein DD-endopeptidase MepM/ murein hydrolase activator NlpD
MSGPGTFARNRGLFLMAAAWFALFGALGAIYAIVFIPQSSPPDPKTPVEIASVPTEPARHLSAFEAGRPAPHYDDVAEPQLQPARPLQMVRLRLDRPLSIDGLLRYAGVDGTERDAWVEAFRSSAHWGILSPGHQVSIFKDAQTGRVQALEYDFDDDSVIRAESMGDGVVFATREPLLYQPQTVAYSLSLAEGLDVAAARKHLPSTVVDQIKSAFATRVPQWQAGGTVKLVYKELVTPDGRHHRNQDLQACKIQVGRHSYCAFSFNDGHGREHLYDERGNSLEPQFLRFPVAFQYISSSFSPSRYHPILHRYRAHVGIDLAARYGTPVRAISDGRIQFADWDGELGRCIRIVHDNGLTSVYAHLSAISPEVTPGAPVRIGQVIGFVGSTGLSTGPHLHYALYKDGRFLDPLAVNLDSGGGGTLASDRRPLFERFRREFERVFARLHPGVANAAITDPAISRLEAFNADAQPPVSFSLPASGLSLAGSVPGSLTPPPTRRREVHLSRGGLLRDTVRRNTPSEALDHLINSGLLGDPSM